MRRFLVLKNYRNTLAIQDAVYKTAKTQSKRTVGVSPINVIKTNHSCNKLITINVIHFNHKCNKYRNWYESEFVSIFMGTRSV